MLKETGLSRRIDDLGRVVIPKDIRAELGITEGDPLDICKDENGVYFRRRNPRSGYRKAIQTLYLNLTHDETSLPETTRKKVLEALATANEALVSTNQREES